MAEQRLDAVVEAHDEAFLLVGDEVQLLQQSEQSIAEPVVGPGGVEVGKIGVKCSYVAVNRHVVVVEYDEEIVLVD